MGTRYRLPDDFDPERDVLIFSLGVGGRADLVRITAAEMLHLLTSEHSDIMGQPVFWAPLDGHSCALWPDPRQHISLLKERRYGNVG